MSQLLEFNSGFVYIVSLYVQTFAVFKVKHSLLPSILHACLDLVKEISEYSHLMKPYSEKLTAFGGEKDKLKKFLDSFSRNVCWFTGMTAYKLIKVKDDKEAKQEKEGDKNKNADDKMQELVI